MASQMNVSISNASPAGFEEQLVFGSLMKRLLSKIVPSLCLPLLSFIALALLPAVANAQVDIYVRGAGKLIPVSVPQLCAESSEGIEAAKEIARVVGRNLDVSGYFEVIAPGSYIESPGKCTPQTGFAYSDWSVLGTEGLVKGVVRNEGGLITVQLYLHDVPKQRVVLGKEYNGDSAQIQLIAHRFSNEVMKFFTGEGGPFGSRIAFSSRVGRFKELFVMEMDGSGARQLTNERGLAVSPSWHPGGTSLVYTSYRSRVPDLFILDLFSRQVRQVTRGEALEISPHFSPDGLQIIASRTAERDSDLVMLNLDGTIGKKLTRGGGAINVSPNWSPDGNQLVFCSNRGGGPQIYTMGADGTNAKRVSFVNSSYCTSPSWSPRGDKIAFVCRFDRGFQIFTSAPDGSNPLQLTTTGDNEDPDWSPDGRYLTFATTFGKGPVFNIGLMRADGSNVRQLTSSRGGDFEPTWGPLP
jgi:TolB protein